MSTFFRDRKRERQTDRQKEKIPVDVFPSFFQLCHPTAALPFAFLLGTMSKGNIKSYPPLQPTESKKYVILMSGERVWVIAYQEYSELQIKNLRMGKPSCSIHHAVIGKNKTKQKNSCLWTILALKEVVVKIKSHECRNSKRPFQKDFSIYLQFFSNFVFWGKL